MAEAPDLSEERQPTDTRTLNRDGSWDAAATPDPHPRSAPAPWRLRVEQGLIESAWLVADPRAANSLGYGRAVVSAARRLESGWELRLGARLDAQVQQGHGADFTRLEVEYDETWLRYRGEDWRLTIGAQKVLWGRTDELSPTDRLSTQDLTRFMLDEMADRRRASPAVRLEWFRDDWTLDLLWQPLFRAAAMPTLDSVLSPVDRRQGWLLGLPTDPLLSRLVQVGRFRDEPSHGGTGGLRASRTGRGFDVAATVQRARHSAPYYRLDQATRRHLLESGGPPFTVALTHHPLFDANHPYTWVIGGDLALAAGAWTWRAEAAWLSAVPVTTLDLRPATAQGFEWVVGAETFPWDRDLRLTVQIAGVERFDVPDILDRRSAYFVLGDLENPFDQGCWRARLRFSLGLDRHDAYLNPELAWLGWEPHEFYLGLHWFDGAGPDTIGGFYRQERAVVLGWRGQF